MRRYVFAFVVIQIKYGLFDRIMSKWILQFRKIVLEKGHTQRYMLFVNY